LLDPRKIRWDLELAEKFEIPVRILPTIGDTGAPAGAVTAEVARAVGQTPAVFRTAGHDTAAAVASVPARGRDWAYISSGTWSLVGVELREPLISSASLAADFTNELGFGGTTRFLRNVAGLWLVQESQRTWAATGQALSWGELEQLAEAAPPLRSLINPDDARFAPPGDMPSRIRAACREHGEPEPNSPGEVVRCVLESLALKYRYVLNTIERLLLREIEVIHIVGGGSRNRLLNQFTADATGKRIIAGPVEATAAGNALIQAIAQRRLGGLADLREVVAASFALETFEPRPSSAWAEAIDRFKRLLY
jgi:rhamnulokinase